MSAYMTGNIETLLTADGDVVDMSDHPSPVVRYTAAHGREYPDAVTGPTGVPTLCHGNARDAARKGLGRYVEGWVTTDVLGPTALIRHAWVEDDEGRAVEVTLPEPADRYIGVVIDEPSRRGWTLTDEAVSA